MKTLTFQYSNNDLTAYAFSCGYKQDVNTESLDKEMYMEYGIYHVRSSKHNTPNLNTDFNGGRTSHNFSIWESFVTLKEARKFYNNIK